MDDDDTSSHSHSLGGCQLSTQRTKREKIGPTGSAKGSISMLILSMTNRNFKRSRIRAEWSPMKSNLIAFPKSYPPPRSSKDNSL